jgi:anti-sigma factor RsiW
MTCDQIRQWSGAWHDRELDLERSAAIEAHLQTCPACQRFFQEEQAFIRVSQTSLPRFAAPGALKTRIKAHLRAEAGEKIPWWQSLKLLRLGGWAMTSIVVALIFLQSWQFQSQRHDLIDQTIANHVRSLQPDHLLEVVSTDQHTVKPWFNGRINFAPTVRDFASVGYQLIGARLDVLDNQTVAALVYQRRKHVINVFTWPVSDHTVPSTALTQRGYQIHSWSKHGMNYVTISDLSETELRDFVAMLQRE